MQQRTRIDSTLDYTLNKQHLPYAFLMPPGATILSIRFDYEPKQSQNRKVGNDLSLTLFDPEGCRGARHNNRQRDLRITAHSATPGYTPGALQPGVWTVWIDTHRVLPPDTIRYWFEIDISDEPLAEPAHMWTKGQVKPRGAGWYRGDLHGHTFHSDGAWDVPDLVQYGRDYKLDFVTLSDHNTVSGLAQMDSLASDDLLTMGGEEFTTYYGHALALGIRKWLDWRIFPPDVTMPVLAQRAKQAGALFIIAHPTSIGDPYCTGCDWQYPDMMPGNARCVEVWNSEWGGDRTNEEAVELWYRWLNKGYRMVGTTGRDIHGPLTDPAPGFDVVYAAEFNERAILQAISEGHLYLSAEPRLELTAVNEDGLSVMMGDLLPGKQAKIKLTWSGCHPGEHLRWVVNGQVAETLDIGEQGEHTWTLDADQAQWAIVEIRGADGSMRAITNPILLGSQWR